MDSNPKIYLFDEAKKHQEIQDCWVIIHGKVYDVTPFMDLHPGGPEVLLAATGKDATKDYEDIGHSDSAKEMMHQYCIGEIDASSIPPKRQVIPPQPAAYSLTPKTDDSMSKILQFLVPLMILGVAFVIRAWTKRD